MSLHTDQMARACTEPATSVQAPPTGSQRVLRRWVLVPTLTLNIAALQKIRIEALICSGQNG